MPNVYCIDDTGEKYKKYSELAAYCCDLVAAGLHFQGVPADSDFQACADRSIDEKFIFDVCTSSTPSVILLDLVGFSNPERRVDINKILKQHVSVSDSFCALAEAVTNPATCGELHRKYYLPFFVCEAARIFGHTVFLFSNDASLKEAAAIKREYGIDGFDVFEETFLTDAKSKLRGLLQTPIERILDLFLQECRRDENWAWHHDKISVWHQKARKALGCEITENEAKALFSLERQRTTMTPFPPFILPTEKKVAVSTLHSILTALEFPGKLLIPENEAEFKLPMQPGIIFLIGLRRMIGCIDPPGRNECRLEFKKLFGGGLFNLGVVWCATLNFSEQYCRSVDHIFRYRGIALNRWNLTPGPDDQAQGRLAVAADGVARGRVTLQGLILDDNLKQLKDALDIQEGPTREFRNGDVVHREPVSVATLALTPGEIGFYWT